MFAALKNGWVVVASVVLFLNSPQAGLAAEPNLSDIYKQVLPDHAKMLQALERVKKCWQEKKASNVIEMANCSEHLVSQDELLGCTEGTVCLASRVCKKDEKPNSGTFDCIPRPSWMDDSAYLAKWGRMLKYQTQTGAEAAEILVPSSAGPSRVANCKRLYEKDTEKLQLCLAQAVFSDADRQAFECTTKYRNDVLDVAIKCLGPRVKVTLSESEKVFARCILAMTNDQEAAKCSTPKSHSLRIAGIQNCSAAARERDPMDLGACLKSLELSSKVTQDAECFANARNNPEGMSKCAGKYIKNPKVLAKLKDGMKGAQCASKLQNGKPEDLLNCMPDGNSVYAKAKNQLDCAAKAVSPFDDGLINCVEQTEDIKRLKSVGDCFKKHANDPVALLDCGGGDKLPKGPQREVINCAARLADAHEKDVPGILAACHKASAPIAQIATRIDKCRAAHEADLPKIPENDAKLKLAMCVVGGERSIPPVASCLIRANAKTALEWAIDCGQHSPVKLEGEAKRIAECYKKNNGDNLQAGLCFAKVNLNPDQALALSCFRDETSNEGRLACAASGYMKNVDPKAAKLLTCAASGDGNYAATATCAAGVQLPFLEGLNPEWRTAVECAASTGGEPISGASCVGTRLAIAEITKCLSGGIGKPGGCFGPNNTIVKFLREYYRPIAKLLKAIGEDKNIRNAINDLTNGPGRNNEVRKALRNLDREAKNVGRNVDREVRTGLGNVEREGRTALREVDKARQRVQDAILKPKLPKLKIRVKL